MAYVKNGQQSNYLIDADRSSLHNSVTSSLASTSVTIQNPLPLNQLVHIGVRCPTTGAEVRSTLLLEVFSLQTTVII